MIDFECPNCGKEIHVQDSAAGMKGKCKKCGSTIKVPDAPPAAAAPADDFFELADEAPAGGEAEPADELAPALPLKSKRAPSSNVPKSAPASSSASILAALTQRREDVTPNEGIALIGGVGGLALLALSTFLPWVRTPFGSSLGVGNSNGAITLALSVASAVAVGYAYTQKKYWLESLLAASAWATLATFWTGSLLVNLWRIPAILAAMVGPGFGLYLAPIAALVAAGALGYVAFQQAGVIQPERRKLFVIGSQAAAVVLGLVLGGSFSAVSVQSSPTIQVGQVITTSPGMPAIPGMPGGANPFAQPAIPSGGGASAPPNGTPAVPDPAHVVPNLNDPANPYAAAIAAKMRSLKQGEIDKLEQKKTESEKARENLKLFQVVQARARLEKRGSRKQWVRELVVKNGTDQAVSRAYFRGTLQSAGRQTPWLTDTFNQKVKGGLEPGEQAEWKIAVGRTDRWKEVEESPDLSYTVEVVRLDGPNGKPIMKADFSEDDQKRLDMLKQDGPPN